MAVAADGDKASGRAALSQFLLKGPPDRADRSVPGCDRSAVYHPVQLLPARIGDEVAPPCTARLGPPSGGAASNISITIVFVLRSGTSALHPLLPFVTTFTTSAGLVQ
jgi:hypothetical protein